MYMRKKWITVIQSKRASPTLPIATHNTYHKKISTRYLLIKITHTFRLPATTIFSLLRNNLSSFPHTSILFILHFYQRNITTLKFEPNISNLNPLKSNPFQIHLIIFDSLIATKIWDETNCHGPQTSETFVLKFSMKPGEIPDKSSVRVSFPLQISNLSRTTSAPMIMATPTSILFYARSSKRVIRKASNALTRSTDANLPTVYLFGNDNNLIFLHASRRCTLERCVCMISHLLCDERYVPSVRIVLLKSNIYLFAFRFCFIDFFDVALI